MTYYAKGSESSAFSDAELRSAVFEALESIGARRKVLAVPPDISRLHSFAGRITEFAWEYYGDGLTDVMPALGTHTPMSDAELSRMFGGLPKSLVRVHRWREDIETVGRVPSDFVRGVSGGRLDYDWPAQLNRLVARGGHDLILCAGQVVPHEVVGMAGQSKSLFVGVGGSEAINKSHFLGAVCGMERIMGRVNTPVRALFDFACDNFIRDLPVVYFLTVVGEGENGKPVVRGLFVGDDRATFERAAALARKVNVTIIAEPPEKIVVFLDPGTFKTTWIGNKAIYRTRMAIADGGELLIVAPGVRAFGEDPLIDTLIREYGYVGSSKILDLARERRDLRENLSVAAHLVHGSSEGRFSITYCAGGLSKAEVERANFRYGDVDAALKAYGPDKLHDGWNELPGGERLFYISNPAMGLWARRGSLDDKSSVPA